MRDLPRGARRLGAGRVARPHVARGRRLDRCAATRASWNARCSPCGCRSMRRGCSPPPRRCALSWLLAEAVALGFAVARGQRRDRHDADVVRFLFLVVAALLPVAGIAVAFGPGVDPAYEIGAAAPMRADRAARDACRRRARDLARHHRLRRPRDAGSRRDRCGMAAALARPHVRDARARHLVASVRGRVGRPPSGGSPS